MQEYRESIAKCGNLADLDKIRVTLLGKKGAITSEFAKLKDMDEAAKKEFAANLNKLRDEFEALLAAKKTELESGEIKAKMKAEAIDITLFNEPSGAGALHPVMATMDKIIEYFMMQNFSLETGPLIEDDFHNFEALNLPKYHPARDMQDTFFIEHSHSLDVTKNVLLRSHTSNDEAHYMSTHQPPIRVLCPGRVYRNEAISARAHCFFHQVEGLYVDKNVSFTDLKQVLLTFAREMFGADTKIRLRPSYFPFTEPSAEMDISCNICGGEGCGFCKHTGWVEILGCGMVDPHDLEACGIDSNVYTGYAFGMGVERITNLKYRVSDLRMFSENDVRFLKEFESAL